MVPAVREEVRTAHPRPPWQIRGHIQREGPSAGRLGLGRAGCQPDADTTLKTFLLKHSYQKAWIKWFDDRVSFFIVGRVFKSRSVQMQGPSSCFWSGRVREGDHGAQKPRTFSEISWQC